jgi:hypothetical protein
MAGIGDWIENLNSKLLHYSSRDEIRRLDQPEG